MGLEINIYLIAISSDVCFNGEATVCLKDVNEGMIDVKKNPASCRNNRIRNIGF